MADSLLKEGWTKNWEGRFSLLFSLIGLDMSQFEKRIGFGPQHALLFYKDGVSSCYFLDEEMSRFGQDLLAVLKRDSGAVPRWIEETRRDIDSVRSLMKESVTEDNFHTIEQLLRNFGVLSFALKELANYLPEKKRGDILPQIEAVRKYGETVYFDTSDYLSRVLGEIGNTTGIPLALLECLAPGECRSYLAGGGLPESGKLERRNLGCAVLFEPAARFLSEEKKGEVERKLRAGAEGDVLKGQVAFPGKVRGNVRIIAKFTSDVVFETGEVLVTGMTDPRYVPLMKKASAIITDAGGILCHAAIVSRELNTPCVVGTRFATQLLKTGDIVEVDAEKGIVRKL